MTGGPFMFGITVNDGCQTVTGSFTIDQVALSNLAGEEYLYLLSDTDMFFIIWPQENDGEVIGETNINFPIGLEMNPVDGKIYTFDADTGYIIELDPDNGPAPVVEVQYGDEIYDITFGPDGTLYAVAYNGIITIDMTTGEIEIFCDDGYYEWAASDSITYSNGYLYTKAYGEEIFRTNIVTGVVSHVSGLNFPDIGEYDWCYQEKGLDYNFKDGKFYSTMYDDNSGDHFLTVIDPATWVATRVMYIPPDFTGLAVPALDRTAPAEVEDLAIDEDQSGCHHAKLTWTDPDDADLDFVMVSWTPNGPAEPVVVQEGYGEAIIIDDIDPETEYTFTVRTVDTEGNMSEGVTFTVTSPACPVIAAPTHPLYLLTGAGSDTKGLLYTLDPLTLETTFIGDTGLEATAGLAINPVDGKMYVTSNENGDLYEIDPATAEATLIGAIGVGNIPDITFGADGTLYGWDRGSNDLITIDLTTGAATIVGDSGIGSWAVGLAFDGDTLMLKSYDDDSDENMYTVDTTTGAVTLVSAISGIIVFPDNFYWLGNVLAIDDNDYYYTVQRDDYPGGNSYLYAIDPDDNKATFLGDLGIIGVSALEFDKH
ncbi:MAG TPA: hypothetical protein PKH10_06705, partial [bacterium]|nr:hypothetical protein [bacterium]